MFARAPFEVTMDNLLPVVPKNVNISSALSSESRSRSQNSHNENNFSKKCIEKSLCDSWQKEGLIRLSWVQALHSLSKESGV